MKRKPFITRRFDVIVGEDAEEAFAAADPALPVARFTNAAIVSGPFFIRAAICRIANIGSYDVKHQWTDTIAKLRRVDIEPGVSYIIVVDSQAVIYSYYNVIPTTAPASLAISTASAPALINPTTSPLFSSPASVLGGFAGWTASAMGEQTKGMLQPSRYLYTAGNLQFGPNDPALTASQFPNSMYQDSVPIISFTANNSVVNSGGTFNMSNLAAGPSANGTFLRLTARATKMPAPIVVDSFTLLAGPAPNAIVWLFCEGASTADTLFVSQVVTLNTLSNCIWTSASNLINGGDQLITKSWLYMPSWTPAAGNSIFFGAAMISAAGAAGPTMYAGHYASLLSRTTPTSVGTTTLVP